MGQALDRVASRGCELLGAPVVLVAVEEHRGLVVRGASGEGAHAWIGSGVLLDTPRPAVSATSACLDAADQSTLLVSTRAGAAGADVWFLESEAENGPRILVAAQDPDPGRLDDCLAWLSWAAQLVVTAERDRSRQQVRGGLHEREDERRRWARELHDETLQGLGAVQVLLSSTLAGASEQAGQTDVLQAVRTAAEMLSRQITGLRHLITELRPAALDELGLRAPLQALARRASAVTGIPVHVHVDLRYADGLVDTRLLPDIEVAVYRVVQEAVTNACRHARATKVRVSVVEDDRQVSVRVSDDGRGLNEASTSAGFGLAGMRERAELAGGSLDVLAEGPHGAGSQGTTVRLIVPAIHRSSSSDSAAEKPHT